MARSTRGYYFGANNTRASVVQNPAAYANDNSSGLFGVKEFRKFGYVSEATRDAAAEKQMKAGYGKRNKACPECFILMPVTGVCDNH
jgi:cysteinyl-tRNA synthetase